MKKKKKKKESYGKALDLILKQTNPYCENPIEINALWELSMLIP
jgi:hypothetical protein